MTALVYYMATDGILCVLAGWTALEFCRWYREHKGDRK